MYKIQFNKISETISIDRELLNGALKSKIDKINKENENIGAMIEAFLTDISSAYDFEVNRYVGESGWRDKVKHTL